MVSRHLPISTFTHQYFFTRLLPIRHLPIRTFTHHRAQLKNRLLPITSRHLPISLFSSTNEEVNRGKINPMQSKASIKIILLTLAMNICNIKPCFPFLATSWGPIPWTPLCMYSMILNSQVHKGGGSAYNDHPSLGQNLGSITITHAGCLYDHHHQPKSDSMSSENPSLQKSQKMGQKILRCAHHSCIVTEHSASSPTQSFVLTHI